MRTLIGRKKEQQELNRLKESNESELVVVYGRRRVGKTYLVNQTFGQDGFSFKVTGLYKKRMNAQLQNFTMAMQEYFNDSTIIQAKTWMEAFSTLKHRLKSTNTGTRRILFFDEMPWMDTAGSDFLSAFEWFWNGWGSAQPDIMLIICGSATNWIINKLFKNKGGLYNRASSRIWLQPFTLAETEEYLTSQGFNLVHYDIAQIYMIMGGIPFYLKQLDPSKPLNGNIDSCFFQTEGKLWNEFENLYDTLFAHSENYLKIVEALSKKRSGMTRNELILATGLPNNGSTTRIIRELLSCGFIRSYKYYGRKSKEKTFQLADYFTMFYYHFVKDNYGQDIHFWSHLLDNPKKQAWLGLTFEQLCKDHIEQIKSALGISGVLTEQSEWHTLKANTDDTYVPGAQIDLLIDRRDNAINLCEIKFCNGEFTIDKDYSMKLRNKAERFREISKTRKSLVTTFISTYGVAKNAYSTTIQQSVTLDDMFKVV